MRIRVCLVFVCVSLCISLLALAACSGAPATQSSSTTHPTPTATTAAEVAPTHTPIAGFTVYASPDHTYQIAYPGGWQQQTADGNPGKSGFTGPSGQYFEVTDNASKPGGDPAQLITDYCQAVQPGQADGQVKGTPVVLDGQAWLKAQCGAEAQPSTILIVEVVTYKGAVYQIDYSSPAATFQADFDAYYSPMEQSFQFLG